MTTGWLDMSASGVQAEDAERQRRSAQLVTKILAMQSGFVLADEVGMGKTYVTFGHIALRTDATPRLRTLVVAPNSDLAEKWRLDMLDFCEKRSVVERGLSRRLKPRVAKTTRELLAIRQPGVLITTLSAVVGGLAKTPDWERAWLFEAALHRSGRHEATRRRLARRFRVAAKRRREARDAEQFGLSLDGAQGIARKHLGRFLLEESSVAREEFDAAVRAARRELIRQRLSRYDLLVLDEAHKLKNPGSKRFQYLEQIVVGRFETMLFLTATPFQIDLSELAAVFQLLGHANGPGRDSLQTRMSRVIELAHRYHDRFQGLDRAWRSYPRESVCLGDDSAPLDPREQILRTAFVSAKQTRDRLARELPKVMLRERKATGHRHERVGSLSPDLDDREAGRQGVAVHGAGRVVFAASVRLFHEMRRNRRPTFDPVVLQSLTSSYAAYRKSSVRARATKGREPFLAGLIDEISKLAEHPKMLDVIARVVATATDGEKTLVFTERIETAQGLAREIADQMDREAEARAEGITRGGAKRLDMLADEFTNRRSSLALSWRDNLLHTLFPYAIDPRELRKLTRLADIRPVIARALREASTGVTSETARKRDIVAAATAVERHVLDRAETIDADARIYGYSLLDSYELLRSGDAGYDDENEPDEDEDVPRFDADDARRVLLATRGFWAHATDPGSLRTLSPPLRARLVAAVRGALIRDDLEARSAILTAIVRGRGRDRAATLESAMRSSRWQPVRARASRFLDLVLEHETEDLRKQWIAALEGTRGKVARLTGNEHEGERTQRGRAFNTPFRPYVVVATSVSQEGLDLQRECSQLIHHDLSWNPARLEQRVGRIDRIHSRTARLREAGRDTTLEVGVPIIRGTIDERMWRVVRNRRSWLDLCLGLEHDWESGTLEDAAPPLPESIASQLRIDLSLAARR